MQAEGEGLDKHSANVREVGASSIRPVREVVDMVVE